MPSEKRLRVEILEYFASERQAHWLEQIRKSDWDAGRFLYELHAGPTYRDVAENYKKLIG